MNSVAELILNRVQQDAQKTAFIFIRDSLDGQDVTYEELHSKAQLWAAALKKSGLQPGDSVIISLDHSPDLFYAFFGVIYCGGVPSIFPYKKPSTSLLSYSKMLKERIINSRSYFVITKPEQKHSLFEILDNYKTKILVKGEMDINDCFNYTSDEQSAYLQYSSGTTGNQKGVVLSHRAILNFMQSFEKVLGTSSSDIIINWLPLYHDFGLFAGFILPLFSGITTVLISPATWLRNPLLYLQLIDKYKGTISFLPNSAHNHMVKIISADELINLDISSLRILANGSEPVAFKSQEIFLKHFAVCGFKESALVCGYGMAENTLGVSMSLSGERSPVQWIDYKKLQNSGKIVEVDPDNKTAKAIVSSGLPLDGVEISIIDKQGRALSEKIVGEICICSDFLFSGYQEDSKILKKPSDSEVYCTGDFGYISNGHLYVIGRKKDLIIVGGVNINPQDLENLTSSFKEIDSYNIVAFGIPDENLGTEKPVIICSLKKPEDIIDKTILEKKIRKLIFFEMGVTLGDICFVDRKWIVRTGNGKLSRFANQKKYLRLKH